MYHLSSCVLSGIVAAAAIMPFVGDPDRPLATLFEQRGMTASWPQPSAGTFVNRAGKGDRRNGATGWRANAKSVAIELIGADDNGAVVYRNRDGGVVFRSDPASGVTMVAKDTILPDAIIRNPAASAAKPVTLEAPRKSKEKTKRPLPDGCESSFSSISDHSLANIPGRCVT
jgi:hypothetical protein